MNKKALLTTLLLLILVIALTSCFPPEPETPTNNEDIEECKVACNNINLDFDEYIIDKENGDECVCKEKT